LEEFESKLNAISGKAIGAAIEVHRVLGPGFLESVYEEALCVELQLQDIRFHRQYPVSLEYKGQKIGQQFLDLIVESHVVVELKAVESLLPIHTAQVLSYLRATGCRLGLLINFNSVVLRDGIKRIVL
jgi:GxxExxY protein